MVDVPLLEGGIVGEAGEVAPQLRALVLAIAPPVAGLPDAPVPVFERGSHGEIGGLDHARPAVLEDEGLNALRIGGGEDGTELTAGGAGAEEGGLFRAGGVHDGAEVVHAGLEAGEIAWSVAQACAALVEEDEAGELGQALAEVNENRLLPGPDEVDHEGDEEDVDRAAADDLVGDGDVAAAGVVDVRGFEVHPRRKTKRRAAGEAGRLGAG